MNDEYIKAITRANQRAINAITDTTTAAILSGEAEFGIDQLTITKELVEKQIETLKGVTE